MPSQSTSISSISSTSASMSAKSRMPTRDAGKTGSFDPKHHHHQNNNKKGTLEEILDQLMNSSVSNVPRSSVPSIPFSIIILTDDPEAWEYNPFLSGTLHGFMKL